MNTNDHSIQAGYGRKRAANRVSSDDEGMTEMDIIEQHRRTARRLSKENGTSHQFELNAIAKKGGHGNWGSYLRSLNTASPASATAADLNDVPAGGRDLNKYVDDLGRRIFTTQSLFQEGDYSNSDCAILAGLILVEISLAKEDDRSPSLVTLRDWLLVSLEEACAQDDKKRQKAAAQGHIHIGNSHKAFFLELAKRMNEAQPYGRTYAEMTRLASMSPIERDHHLIGIISALTEHIEDIEKAA